MIYESGTTTQLVCPDCFEVIESEYMGNGPEDAELPMADQISSMVDLLDPFTKVERDSHNDKDNSHRVCAMCKTHTSDQRFAYKCTYEVRV